MISPWNARESGYAGSSTYPSRRNCHQTASAPIYWLPEVACTHFVDTSPTCQMEVHGSRWATRGLQNRYGLNSRRTLASAKIRRSWLVCLAGEPNPQIDLVRRVRLLPQPRITRGLAKKPLGWPNAEDLVFTRARKAVRRFGLLLGPPAHSCPNGRGPPGPGGPGNRVRRVSRLFPNHPKTRYPVTRFARY